MNENLTSETLRKALELQESIENQQQELQDLLNGNSPRAAEAPRKPTKTGRTMSPESRARIAEAQRRRWARQKAGKH